MKIPGFKNIAKGLKHIFQKFPVESLFTVISTLFALALVNSYDRAYHFPKWILEDGLMTLHISILFYLGINLWIKYSSEENRKTSSLLYLFILIPFLLFYYFRDIEKGTTQVWIQYWILNFTGHLWVASIAFLINRGQLMYFWSFNKRIFLRLLSSFFYSLVLYLGISLAILALQYLFGLEVENTFYESLGVWTGITFNTFYFLGGIPTNRSDLFIEEGLTYPKSLKYFTQYVLLPLVSLYLLILLSYEIKLLVQWTLPKGWVSEMIIAYAIFGILSILLVHPIKNNLNNQWINVFSRYYFISLIPLSVLFFLALYRRISDYGFTEDRYILLLLAFWIMGISIFMILKKDYPIRYIPISLWILALFCLFNPWNLFETTKISQLKRFEKSLKQPEESGTKMESKVIQNFPRKAELFYYLFDRYSYKPFQKLVKINLDSLNDQYNLKRKKTTHSKFILYYHRSEDSMRTFLVKYFDLDDSEKTSNEKKEENFQQINFTVQNQNQMVNVRGWDFYTTRSLSMDNGNYSSTDSISIDGDKNNPLVISQLRPYQTLLVKLGKDIISLDLKSQINYLNTLKSEGENNMYINLDINDLTLDKNTFRFIGENNHYKIQLYIIGGNAEFNKKGFKMDRVEFGIYVRKKSEN